MVAINANAPEWEIGDDEQKAFTKAAENYMRHYSVETTQKTLDGLALGAVCVQVFGTRAMATAARLREQKRSPGQGAHDNRVGPAQVFPFPDGGQGGGTGGGGFSG